MAAGILLSRPVRQPHISVVDWGNPVTRGLQALFDCRIARDVVSGAKASAISSIKAHSLYGACADFSSSNQQYNHRANYVTTGPMTIIAFMDVDALTNYGAIIAKQESSTKNAPYELRLGSGSTDSVINLLRSNSASEYGVNYTAGGSLIAAGAKSVCLAVTSETNETVSPGNVWINGVKTALSFSGNGHTVSDSGTSSVYIGQRLDSATALDGRIYFVALYGRALSDSEVQTISANPWQLFKGPERRWASSSLANAYTITASSGSYAITGNTTALTAQRKVTAASGTYSITGNATGLRRGYTLAGNVGTYSITGSVLGLACARKITAVAGTYAQTGNAAGLAAARMLAAAQGSYSVTGSSASLKADRNLAASAGSYAITGSATGLAFGRVLSASAGSYATTGNAVGLYAARRTAPSSGTYSITGNDVGLAYTQGASISANSGSYVMTGSNVSMTVQRRLACVTASYAQTGNAVALCAGRKLVVNSATYSLSGVNAALLYGRRIVLASGNYAITGSTAGLTYSAAVINYSPRMVYTIPAISAQYTVPAEDRTFTIPVDDRNYEVN